MVTTFHYTYLGYISLVLELKVKVILTVVRQCNAGSIVKTHVIVCMINSIDIA